MSQNIRNLFFVFGLLSSVFSLQVFAADAPRFYGEEVVVTAAKYVQPRFKSPWNVAILSEKEIKASNTRTAGEILRQVPGLDVRALGDLSSVSTAGLRVIGAEKTLVLLDGRRINSPLSGMADLNDILLANVTRIEVVKAPASALYGSDAHGGVINIVTKKGEKEISRDFSLALGSIGEYQLKASLAGENGVLLAQLLKSDGFRQNADYNSINLKGSYGWKYFNNTDLNLDVLLYNAQKGVPNVPSTDAWSASKPKDRQDDQNLFLDLSSKTAWLENSELSTRLFGTAGNQTFRSFNVPGTIETQTKNNFTQAGVEIKNLQKLDAGNLLYGIEVRQDTGNSTAGGVHTLNNLASFVQWELDNKNLTLTTGIRGDRHSVAGKSFNPRLGILFPLKDDLSLRATYGTSFRAPTLNELYWTGPFTTGNTALKPEKSNTYEIGVRKIYSPSSFQLTYHNSAYNDLIYWSTDQTTFIQSPVNVATAKIEGLELEIEQQITNNLTGFVNYTYQKSTGTDPTTTVTVSGEDLIYMPRNKYNLGLRFESEAVNAALNVRYVGERNYIDFPPPTYAVATKQLPSFWVANVKFSKNVGKFNLSLGADNLFNASYSEAVGFSPVSIQPALGYPAPGRKLTFGVEYKL
jgi:vitamin B12 transporter